MDVVGNVYNSNNPAELPMAQKHLQPLIQESKKGPAIDFDAFLLVMLQEHLQGGSQSVMFVIDYSVLSPHYNTARSATKLIC